MTVPHTKSDLRGSAALCCCAGRARPEPRRRRRRDITGTLSEPGLPGGRAGAGGDDRQGHGRPPLPRRGARPAGDASPAGSPGRVLRARDRRPARRPAPDRRAQRARSSGASGLRRRGFARTRATACGRRSRVGRAASPARDGAPIGAGGPRPCPLARRRARACRHRRRPRRDPRACTTWTTTATCVPDAGERPAGRALAASRPGRPSASPRPVRSWPAQGGWAADGQRRGGHRRGARGRGPGRAAGRDQPRVADPARRFPPPPAGDRRGAARACRSTSRGGAAGRSSSRSSTAPTHPVRWVAVTLTDSDERSLYLMQFPPGGELPAVIEPGDSHHTWVAATELERSGLDLAHADRRRGQARGRRD